MKVLLVNNFYYNRGGDCTYMFALKKLFEENGHKVIVFSMHHPLNFPSEYSKYFVSYINYDEEVRKISLASGIRVLSRTIFSWEAGRRIEELIDEERPDIAHINNIHHHITPSIFYPLKRHKIPIVWTLHDYTIICPNTSFLAHGRICERCRKTRYFWAPLIRCKKDSFLASLVAGIESTIHRLTRVNDLVDVFITPSEFLREKLIEYGFKEDRIICMYHFSEPISDQGDVLPNGYILYVGRLSHEKGIRTLIDAVSGQDVTLKIIGDGPLREEMVNYVKLKGTDRIEFLGHMSHDEVLRYMKGCRFVVMPSEWYENYPFAVIEAFARGKPVIGSDTGGLPELIRDTERGLLFEMGSPADLSATINYLLKNPDLVTEIGENARRFVMEVLNGRSYYERLIALYEALLSKKP
ncbi:MAG: glycosyltransferase family 4 protein [Thermodesulfovibrionia bacterium]